MHKKPNNYLLKKPNFRLFNFVSQNRHKNRLSIMKGLFAMRRVMFCNKLQSDVTRCVVMFCNKLQSDVVLKHSYVRQSRGMFACGKLSFICFAASDICFAFDIPSFRYIASQFDIRLRRDKIEKEGFHMLT